MTEYKLINLKLLTEEVGEEKAKDFLSDYSCPLNEDVETFLKLKAINFSQRGWAQTHLVMASYNERPMLVGYFALSNKYIHIKKSSISNTLRKKVNQFAKYNHDLNAYTLASPLIGQIGKNYAAGLNEQITGDELLKMACDKVGEAHLILGGRTVYLECEDKPKLFRFYESNGFVSFGKRMLDADEVPITAGKYLLQYIRYL